MHFEGTQQIKASSRAVFDSILDPDRVAACAPGFISMEKLAPNHYKPTLGVGIGAVRAKFTLDVQVEDIREFDHAAMKGHGVAAGSAVDMNAAIDLVPVSDAETTMNWAADVIVSGTIASVGARLLESTARKQIAKFFDCFREKLEEPDTSAAPQAAQAPET